MNHFPRARFSLVALLSTGVLVVSLVIAMPEAARAADYDSPLQVFNSLVTSIKTTAAETKDWAFDALAWQAANLAIESITKSTVNWINSGFQGSPAFVTDLNENLGGVGDAVAAQFFEELGNQTIATTPFQDKVLDTVRLGYYLSTSPESFYTRYPYTLDQVSANDRAFLEGDFSQGGFNAWFATVMNPQNNPYGAQDLADQELARAVSNATNNRLQELSWNRGFLSWRGECVNSDETDTVSLTGAEPCVEYAIETPGSVIMEQLNNQLGSGVDRLVSADEFNEIIGALLNQLASQVLGGNSGGLRGVSRPASGGGGSFFDQTGGSGGSGAAIARSFSATIVSQRQTVDAFRVNWEKIRAAANLAEQRCSTNGQPNAQTVLNQAAAMLAKAADAIAALEAIQAEIAEASAQGGDQTLALLAITEKYNALINSDILPTPQEIAEAQTQSQDTGDAEPSSLYTQLTRQAGGSCNASGS